MSDFKAKIHQIRFRLGLRHRPRWGAYIAPLDPLAGLRGPTSKRMTPNSSKPPHFLHFALPFIYRRIAGIVETSNLVCEHSKSQL